jgi:hypothetical protein
MEALLKISDAGAHGILYLMGIVSLVSVSIMIERYFSLRKVSQSSTVIAGDFKKMIEGQDLDNLTNLSKENNSLESKALGYGLTFVKKHGIDGLDELPMLHTSVFSEP